jgi:ketosteroid isomerase-like protein
VLVRNRFKGRDGIELESENQAIFTLAGGRVTRVRDFMDEEEARQAFEAGSVD